MSHRAHRARRSLDDEIKEANRRCRADLLIRQTTDQRGHGLFAQRDITSGEMIFSARAIDVLHGGDGAKTSHTVQTGWVTHVVMDLPARFINHSCDANCGIRDNALGAYDFFALRPISTGDELLWDYSAAEYAALSLGSCLCASAACRGEVRGFKHDGDEVRRQYGDYYARYLRGMPGDER